MRAYAHIHRTYPQPVPLAKVSTKNLFALTRYAATTYDFFPKGGVSRSV